MLDWVKNKNKMIVTERFARRQAQILLSLYSITLYSASLSIVVVVVAGLFFVFGEGQKTQRKL